MADPISMCCTLCGGVAQLIATMQDAKAEVEQLGNTTESILATVSIIPKQMNMKNISVPLKNLCKSLEGSKKSLKKYKKKSKIGWLFGGGKILTEIADFNKQMLGAFKILNQTIALNQSIGPSKHISNKQASGFWLKYMGQDSEVAQSRVTHAVKKEFGLEYANLFKTVLISMDSDGDGKIAYYEFDAFFAPKKDMLSCIKTAANAVQSQATQKAAQKVIANSSIKQEELKETKDDSDDDDEERISILYKGKTIGFVFVGPKDNLTHVRERVEEEFNEDGDPPFLIVGAFQFKDRGVAVRKTQEKKVKISKLKDDEVEIVEKAYEKKEELTAKVKEFEENAKKDPKSKKGAAQAVNAGVSYYNGNGVPKNHVKAFELFEQASNGGNASGAAWAGYMVWAKLVTKVGNRTLGPQDAFKFFEKSTESTRGQRWLAYCYFVGYAQPNNTPNYKKCYEVCLKGLAKGNKDILCYLTNLHYQGLGGAAKDYVKAREYGEASVEAGVTESGLIVGHLYTYGLGTALDYKQGAKYYKISTKDYPDSWYYLGQIHEKGQGHPVNKAYALECYKNGAARGHALCKQQVAALS